MEKFGIILSAALAFIMSMTAQAQTTVKGVAADSLSGRGEVGAIIQFFKTGQANPVAYAATDSLGQFSKSITGEGEYEMLFSNMGKKDVRRHFTIGSNSPEVIDLGRILVQDDVQTLKNASVSAMKTLVKLDVDKLTYQVESDPDSKSSSVLDMLRKVPMVTVDGQDNITVNGSGSFKVYVDGKPNQMISGNPSQILKAMPASAIKNIEVITNPGAKYDAEGVGGVLNLITDTAASGSKVADGVYGSLTAGVTSRGGGNGGLFLSAKKGKFTLGTDISAGYQPVRGVVTDAVQKQYASAGNSEIDSHSETDSKTPFVFGDLNASYELDTCNLFSASFGVMGFKNRSTGLTSLDMIGLTGYGYSSDVDSRYSSIGMNASVDYQRTSRRVKGRTMTVSYRFSGTPVNRRNDNIFRDFTGALTSLDSQRSKGNDNSDEHTFQLDFTTPVGKGQTLSSGLKYILRHNSADDKLYLDSGSGFAFNQAGSMIYDHFNNIGAAYSEYSGTFGKFSAKVGMRYEYTWQNVEYGEGYGHDFDSRYGDLVPSASFQFNLGPAQNIGLSYNMRIQRPGITYLNPYVDKSQLTSVSYGNSDLDCAKSHIFSLVYNFYSPKWVVSLTGRYNRCGNGISAYSFYDGNVLNNTYGNVVVSQTTGLNAFVNWTASKKTRIYANSEISYVDFSSKALDQSNNGWKTNLMLGCQQTLPADILLSANLMMMGRSISLQGWSSGFSGLAAGISKSFLADKLKVQIQCFSNLGKGKMNMEMHSSGKSFESVSHVDFPIRQVSLSLTYSFGKRGFEVKKTQRTIRNDDVINAESNQQSPAQQVGGEIK